MTTSIYVDIKQKPTLNFMIDYLIVSIQILEINNGV